MLEKKKTSFCFIPGRLCDIYCWCTKSYISGEEPCESSVEIKIHSHMKHHGVKISQPITRRQTGPHRLWRWRGIKCSGQVWKKIDFFLIWYIKGEWDKDGQRKSKRGTWRAINFPVVSSMAAAPFHTLPIRTFPNQRNTSPSLKWRQLQSLTFPLAPKLCRLQRRYTKNKALGRTAGGTLVLVGGKKKKITCGNLLALLTVPEKLTGNNSSPAQHLSWHNIKRWFWQRIDFKKKNVCVWRRRKGRGGRGRARGVIHLQIRPWRSGLFQAASGCQELTRQSVSILPFNCTSHPHTENTQAFL